MSVFAGDVELIPVQEAHKAALTGGNLAELLSASIPAGWPHFPEAFTPGGPGGDPAWPGFLIVSRAAGSLVGNGGFYGPPDAAGAVEIGYEIAPAFQRRGFATAFVRALIARAFADAKVSAVIAHTLAGENASNAVLRKAGMTFDSAHADPEVGPVWRWRIARA